MHVSKKQGYGYLTFALNTGDTDYESMAMLFALSVKATHAHKMPMAVIVNDTDSCRQDLYDVFDHVIQVPKREVVNNMQYEALICDVTPFKETVKFESDMLLTSDISIWQHHYRNYDLCFTSYVLNNRQEKANDKRYRTFIRKNLLPNVYSGLYYVRTTRSTVMLMKEVWRIFSDWHSEIKKYRLWEKHEPSTDFAMSMALNNLNFDNVCDKSPLPTFVHNKPAITGEMRYWSIPDPQSVIVNGQRLSYPWHYHDKHICTPELIARYKKHGNI
jgi:hypothetical protein|tara:strand:+ start:5542 stop:6360 length:819 start_codon:yes stop_codon:yes gene_type:complete